MLMISQPPTSLTCTTVSPSLPTILLLIVLNTCFVSQPSTPPPLYTPVPPGRDTALILWVTCNKASGSWDKEARVRSRASVGTSNGTVCRTCVCDGCRPTWEVLSPDRNAAAGWRGGSAACGGDTPRARARRLAMKLVRGRRCRCGCGCGCGCGLVRCEVARLWHSKPCSTPRPNSHQQTSPHASTLKAPLPQ